MSASVDLNVCMQHVEVKKMKKEITIMVLVILSLKPVFPQDICETCMIEDPAMCPPECFGGGDPGGVMGYCGDGLCDIGEEETCPEDCGGGATTTTIEPGVITSTTIQATTTSTIEETTTTSVQQTTSKTEEDITTTSTTITQITPTTTLQSMCGNELCETGENCASCLQDCLCPSGFKCSDGLCLEKKKSNTLIYIVSFFTLVMVVVIAVVILKSRPKKVDEHELLKEKWSQFKN